MELIKIGKVKAFSSVVMEMEKVMSKMMTVDPGLIFTRVREQGHSRTFLLDRPGFFA